MVNVKYNSNSKYYTQYKESLLQRFLTHLLIMAGYIMNGKTFDRENITKFFEIRLMSCPYISRKGIAWKNMAEFLIYLSKYPEKRHFIPVIILPNKVFY